MPDREKVIKGLDVCSRVAEGEPCPKDCPYYQDVCYGYGKLMQDALELLREDPANAVREGLHYVCGNCLKMLPPLSVYCPQCGKRLTYE